jgi:tetratricopeptide (TPR) repeat protein
MNRREFIGTVTSVALLRQAKADVAVEVVRPKNSYEALLKDIEPGHDDFPLEKEAFEIASHLKRLTETRSLPYASDLSGASPFPVRYEPVAEGVLLARYDASDANVGSGLQKWLDSLGDIRAARFYVLPNDEVRYEIASAGKYRVGRWQQRWIEGRLAHFSPIEETVTTSPIPLFRDITGWSFGATDSFRQQLSKGVPYWRARLDAASGIDVHGHNGIAAGDIDGDGLDEIYVCQPGGLPNRLYKNRGDGTLEDITDHAGVGVLDPTSSALFVDFRNSGRQDLVVLRPDGPLLFLNQGGNRFTSKPGAFRFATAPQGSFTGMAAADYDRDGRVDLYLCTYSFFRDGTQYRYPSPYQDARNGPPNFLFRNQLTTDGNGMFQDVTDAVGLNQNNDRFSFAPAWCDYDGDGWPDLYVANDFGRKNLYKNEGGRFRDVAAEAGVEDLGDGMSASWFDYDGDGRPDLYVSNMWSNAGQRIVTQKEFQPARRGDPRQWRRHAKGNSLYRNRGDGTFEETGAAEGVEMGRWAWGSDGIDFDNDGVPEIFVTAGMLTNSSETDLESFFWRKVAAESPASAKPDPAYESGWNALSQAVHEEFSEAGRQPNLFYVRRGSRYYDFSGVSGLDFADDSRAFAVTDLDGDGNLDMLLKSRLGPQVRVFRNDSAAGRKAIAFRLRGVKSNRDAIGARVEVDGKVKFIQAGSGYLSQHTKVLHFGLGDAATAKIVRILWPTGTEQEFHGLSTGALHEIDEDSSEVRRQPFRARREIPAGGARGENEVRFADTWLLEPVLLPEQVAGPAFLRLSALSAERAGWYGIFCRYLFDVRANLKLPIWFLVDEASRAHKIYFSSPDPNDLKLLNEKIVVPFAGTFYTRPARNYAALGAAFFGAGFADQALRYLLLAPQSDSKNLFAIGQIHLEAGRWDPARHYYQEGLAISPQAADGWNNLGAVEMGAGSYAVALDRYRKALALRPDMTSALVNAGQAHLALGDREAAEKMFRRALEINPSDSAAANQMGELLVRQGRDQEAKSWFQRAIEGRRDYAPAIGNLGALYLRVGQPNDAIAAFRYGIEIMPDEESFYLNLASAYVGTGNPDAAREIVRRLLTRKPASAKARQALRELEP